MATSPSAPGLLYPNLKPREARSVRTHLIREVRRPGWLRRIEQDVSRVAERWAADTTIKARANELAALIRRDPAPRRGCCDTRSSEHLLQQELRRRLDAGGLAAVCSIVGHPCLDSLQREEALAVIAAAFVKEHTPRMQAAVGHPSASPRRVAQLTSPRRSGRSVDVLLRDLGDVFADEGHDEDALVLHQMADRHAIDESVRRVVRAVSPQLRRLRRSGRSGPRPDTRTELAVSLHRLLGLAGLGRKEKAQRFDLIHAVVHSMIGEISREALRQRA
jgi:hypothetical protein